MRRALIIGGGIGGSTAAMRFPTQLLLHLSGSSAPVDGLRADERERRPRAASFVRRSRNVGRVAQWSQPLAVALRNFAVRHTLACSSINSRSSQRFRSDGPPENSFRERATTA